MNKKGFAIELIAFIVIGIIVVLFFGGLIYGFTLVSNTMGNIDLVVGNTTISAASGITFGNLSSGMSNLRLISFVIIIAYAISTLIVAYFSSRHPIWLFIYILITVILVIFSVYISNAYDTMKENATIASMVSGFGLSDAIISGLPVWVSIIGLAGISISIIGIMMVKRYSES